MILLRVVQEKKKKKKLEGLGMTVWQLERLGAEEKLKCQPGWLKTQLTFQLWFYIAGNKTVPTRKNRKQGDVVECTAQFTLRLPEKHDKNKHDSKKKCMWGDPASSSGWDGRLQLGWGTRDTTQLSTTIYWMHPLHGGLFKRPSQLNSPSALPQRSGPGRQNKCDVNCAAENEHFNCESSGWK